MSVTTTRQCKCMYIKLQVLEHIYIFFWVFCGEVGIKLVGVRMRNALPSFPIFSFLFFIFCRKEGQDVTIADAGQT